MRLSLVRPYPVPVAGDWFWPRVRVAESLDTGGMAVTQLTQILELFSKFAIIGGGLWAVWGAITFGGALKDQNGPDMKSGMWQIVGGGLICAAAAIFKTVAL